MSTTSAPAPATPANFTYPTGNDGKPVGNDNVAGGTGGTGEAGGTPGVEGGSTSAYIAVPDSTERVPGSGAQFADPSRFTSGRSILDLPDLSIEIAANLPDNEKLDRLKAQMVKLDGARMMIENRLKQAISSISATAPAIAKMQTDLKNIDREKNPDAYNALQQKIDQALAYQDSMRNEVSFCEEALESIRSSLTHASDILDDVRKHMKENGQQPDGKPNPNAPGAKPGQTNPNPIITIDGLADLIRQQMGAVDEDLEEARSVGGSSSGGRA